MRYLVILMMGFAASSANALDTKDKNALDRWATKKQSELFKECSKLFRTEWLKRYDKVGVDFVMKIEEIGPGAVKDRKKSPIFWDFGRVVYPYNLPKNFPMKGAFDRCSDDFEDYRNARNNVESMKAMNQFEQCQKDSYRADPPPVLKEYISCLKRIKY